MKIIKVTSLKDKKPVYLNVEQIGHFFREFPIVFNF